MAVTLVAAARREVGKRVLNKLQTVFRHVWLDASDTKRIVPPDMLALLTQRVAASEARHTGEIRIYIEAALPLSYLRRLGSAGGGIGSGSCSGPETTMAQLVRQRATMLFSKLCVWDTEHNNGVLIYLLLAEQAIEIVADRGLHARVAGDEWQALVTQMSAHFKQGRFEDGLTDALAQVSALLAAHFPQDASAPHTNNQPNEPVQG